MADSEIVKKKIEQLIDLAGMSLEEATVEVAHISPRMSVRTYLRKKEAFHNKFFEGIMSKLRTPPRDSEEGGRRKEKI